MVGRFGDEHTEMYPWHMRMASIAPYVLCSVQNGFWLAIETIANILVTIWIFLDIMY